MSQYALIAMLGVRGGVLHEATREAEDMEQVGTFLKELEEHDSPWQAITIVHIEDLPLVLDGAQHVPVIPLGSKNKCGRCGEGITYCGPTDNDGRLTGSPFWDHDHGAPDHQATPMNESSS